MGVFETRFPIAQWSAIQLLDRATRGLENRLPSRNVPLHGAAKSGVDVGLSIGQQTKLQGGTGMNDLGNLTICGIDISEVARRAKAAAFKEEQAIAQKYWELYSKPMSLDEVGAVFGLSDSTVRAVLIRHGYEIRKRGRIENSDCNQMKPRQPKPKKNKQQAIIPAENMEATGKALDLLISNTKVK